MSKILVQRHSAMLAPVHPEDKEYIMALSPDEVCEVEIKKLRNGRFHKRFFALLNVIVRHTDFTNTNQVLHILKLRTGYYDTLTEPNTGKTFLQPKSISFAKMDETEFNKFYNDAVNAALEFLLEGWTKETLDEAYNEILHF